MADKKKRTININGVTYIIPMHINRIDTSKTKLTSPTVGFQVRFCRTTEGYYSKLFSDSRYGTLGALLEATIHLQVKQAEFTENDKIITARTGHKPRVVWRLSKNRSAPCCSVTIRLMTTNNPPDENEANTKNALYYAGTESTITQVSLDAAYLKAYAAWYWATDYINEHGKSALYDYPSVPGYEVTRHHLPDGFELVTPDISEVMALLPRHLNRKLSS